MVFNQGNVPSGQLDSATQYTADMPMDRKQAAITTRRHRWFQSQFIGTPTGLYTRSPGLNALATWRVFFDKRPDWILVSVSGQTAVTGRVWVYVGEQGGEYIQLGPHGYCTFPVSQDGVVVLVNQGSTPTYGVVCAIAGYTDPGIQINCGD